MSQQNDSSTLSRVTAEAIEEFRLVRQNSSDQWVYADAGEKPIGCIEGYVGSGLPASANLLLNKQGTQRMMAAGVVAKYAKVYSAADGKIDDTVTGCLVGTALEAATADGDIIEILPEINDDLAPPASTKVIWADVGRTDTYTADGSEAKPYKTLAAAWAALTATRNSIRLKAGTYTTVAATPLALPAHDVKVRGEGAMDDVVIESNGAAVFNRAAGALTGTTSYTWDNLTIEHGDTYKGIVIDNTSATKKIILSLDGVEFGGSANAIDVATHGDASNGVRLYVNDNRGREIEGPVSFVVGNDGDIIRIKNAVLSGGLVTGTSATVMEITLQNCEVLHEGVTGGNAAQVLNVISCHSRTGATIAAFDTSDAAGSHTENILAV